MVLSPPVFSNYSSLVLRQQPGQAFLEPILVIEFTILTVPHSLGHVAKVLLGELALIAVCAVTGTALLGFFPQSFATASMKSGYLCSWRDHHLILIVRFSSSRDSLGGIGQARCAGYLVPHRWKTGEVLEWLECHTTLPGKRPLDSNVPIACRALPARAVLFAVDRLISKNESCKTCFGADGTLGSASDGMGSELCNDELFPYLADNCGNDSDIAVVPVDSHDDVRVSLRRDSDAILDLCRLANVALLQVASRVFTLALQTLTTFSEPDSEVSAIIVALERVSIVEETTAASLPRCTLEKADMVCERDESCQLVERFKTDLAGVCKQVSGAALQFELCDS